MKKLGKSKKSPQQLGVGKTREWYYHGSDTPISPWAILLGAIELLDTLYAVFCFGNGNMKKKRSKVGTK